MRPAVALCSRDGYELPLRWRLRRIIHDSLARAGCGELADRALNAIALIVAICRGHLVVIRHVRLQIGHTHAENRLRMGPVDSYGRFRRLAQVLGINTE